MTLRGKPISQEELTQLFGGSVPENALKTIGEHQGTPDKLREKLALIAAEDEKIVRDIIAPLPAMAYLITQMYEYFMAVQWLATLEDSKAVNPKSKDIDDRIAQAGNRVDNLMIDLTNLFVSPVDGVIKNPLYAPDLIAQIKVVASIVEKLDDSKMTSEQIDLVLDAIDAIAAEHPTNIEMIKRKPSMIGWLIGQVILRLPDEELPEAALRTLARKKLDL